MSDTPNLPDEDLLFRLLRQLDAAPELSQCATAQALGISLGRLNAVLRAVTDAGLVRIATRDSTDRRSRMAYALTPQGAAEKARLTDSFLSRKLAEYDALHAELTGTGSGIFSLKTRTLAMQTHLSPIQELYVSPDSAQKLKREAADLL